MFINVFNKFCKSGAKTRMLKVRISVKNFEIREHCFDSLFNMLGRHDEFQYFYCIN